MPHKAVECVYPLECYAHGSAKMEADAEARMVEHPELRADPDPVVCTCGGVGFGQHLTTCPVITGASA